MLKFIQNNREATALLAILALFALLGVIDSNYFSMQTGRDCFCLYLAG